MTITTTAGEVFSLHESIDLARLVFKRFGRDYQAATEAWRRLLESNTEVEDFRFLVEHPNPQDPWKFEPLHVHSARMLVRVSLKYGGDGNPNGIDPDDPAYVSLLRFEVSMRWQAHYDQEALKRVAIGSEISNEEDWMELRDSLQPTQLSVFAPRDHLVRAAIFLLRDIEERVLRLEKIDFRPYRWLGLKDGQPKCQEGLLL